MPTECSADLFGFAAVEGRRVEAAFDGGTTGAISCLDYDQRPVPGRVLTRALTDDLTSVSKGSPVSTSGRGSA